MTRQMLRLIGAPFTLDIGKARRDLGYVPVISREKGLEAMSSSQGRLLCKTTCAALVSRPAASTSGRFMRRRNSLIAELRHQGVVDVPMQIMTPPATLEVSREGLRQLFEHGAVPEVVVCSSDTIAQGVLAEAASRGLQVPTDLAVMGFGDLSSAAHVYPALSTVRVDGKRIGDQVAKALLDRFQHPTGSAEPVRIDTGFTIVDRQST